MKFYFIYFLVFGSLRNVVGIISKWVMLGEVRYLVSSIGSFFVFCLDNEIF